MLCVLGATSPLGDVHRATRAAREALAKGSAGTEAKHLLEDPLHVFPADVDVDDFLNSGKKGSFPAIKPKTQRDALTAWMRKGIENARDELEDRLQGAIDNATTGQADDASAEAYAEVRSSTEDICQPVARPPSAIESSTVPSFCNLATYHVPYGNSSDWADYMDSTVSEWMSEEYGEGAPNGVVSQLRMRDVSPTCRTIIKSVACARYFPRCERQTPPLPPPQAKTFSPCQSHCDEMYLLGCPGMRKYHCVRVVDLPKWHCPEGARDCFSVDNEKCTFYPEPLYPAKAGDNDCVSVSFDTPDQFLTRSNADAIHSVFSAQVRADLNDVEVVTSMVSPHFKVNIFAIDKPTTQVILSRLHYMTASGKLLRLQMAKAIGYAPQFSFVQNQTCVRNEMGSASFPELEKPCPVCPTPAPSTAPADGTPQTIEMTMVVAGSVVDYDVTAVQKVKAVIATLAGVDVGDVSLSMEGGSVMVTCRVVVKPPRSAADALAELKRTLGSTSSATLMLGVTVEEPISFTLVGAPTTTPTPTPTPASYLIEGSEDELRDLRQQQQQQQQQQQAEAGRRRIFFGQKARSRRLAALSPTQLLADLHDMSGAPAEKVGVAREG